MIGPKYNLGMRKDLIGPIHPKVIAMTIGKSVQALMEGEGGNRGRPQKMLASQDPFPSPSPIAKLDTRHINRNPRKGSCEAPLSHSPHCLIYTLGTCRRYEQLVYSYSFANKNESFPLPF